MSRGRGCLIVSPYGSVTHLNYSEATPAANITSAAVGEVVMIRFHLALQKGLNGVE